MKMMGKKSRDTVPLKGRRHKICIHNVSFTNPSGSLIRKLRVFSNIVSIYTRRISWQKFKKTDSAVSMIIQSVVSIFEYWNPRIKNPIRKFVDTWIRAQMDYCNKNRRKMSHDMHCPFNVKTCQSCSCFLGHSQQERVGPIPADQPKLLILHLHIGIIL